MLLMSWSTLKNDTEIVLDSDPVRRQSVTHAIYNKSSLLKKDKRVEVNVLLE